MSNILITDALSHRLQDLGINTLHKPGHFKLPEHSVFEPPCSIKWMTIDHSVQLGAFSYAVSGYYFATRIGRYVSIGENVQIGRHSHPIDFASTSPVLYMGEKASLSTSLLDAFHSNASMFKLPHVRSPATLKETIIGCDVYIGHGAMVMPGIKIGDGAVVGAMSVVTKDVLPYSIVAGSPARVVRERFSSSVIEKLIQLKWYDFSPIELSQIPIDNITQFIDGVQRLRDENTKVYAPNLINLSELLPHDSK
jgi:acetyltransferase-like isoleucine patch superfamily enzyme